MARETDRRTFAWIFWILLAAAAFTLSPLWLPLLLAAWFAGLARPVVDRLTRAFGGRQRPAVWVALGLLPLILVPVTIAVIQVIVASSDFVRRFMEKSEWQTALQSLATDGEGGPFLASGLLDLRQLMDIVGQHGGTALGILSSIFGATTTAVISIFVFIMGCYTFLGVGRAYWPWIVEHAPLEPSRMERFHRVFHETGRGLVIGMGLTALAQGVVATIAYAALGVPRAFLLGELTFFSAFIPSFGTALVWLPVAAGLALSGAYVKAAILSLIGIFVIGTIDNILRPVFSRWGALDLPVFVLIISIFGGFVVFGAWGFVLGPLVVRMAKEALVMAREPG